MSFLFGAMLWALPLAGLPVVLHLLFRRKSPVVQFSTLRFIKSSLQHTAARRRVQRWMLLAVRMLLLGLLIWALAQPAKILAQGWFSSSESVAAVVVVDTSYSMMLQEQQVTLLDRADNITQDLLRTELKDAKVAVMRSMPPAPGQAEQLQSASEILGQWSHLMPQPNPVPLADRIAGAEDLLRRSDASQKLLFIITDSQRREFPHSIADLDGGRIIEIDLHPDHPRSAGIAKISVDPEQPVPGVGADVAVDLTGQAGDTRSVMLSGMTLDGQKLFDKPALMAEFDQSGRSRVSFPDIKLPPERWLLLDASVLTGESLPWSQERTQLVEMPPRQIVTVLPCAGHPMVDKFLRLALDPTAGDTGQPNTWPLEVHAAADLSGKENVVVAPLSAWPDEPRIKELTDFAHRGGIVLLCVQPGLETLWDKLPDSQKSALAALLPSQPYAMDTLDSAYRAAPAEPDPLLRGLTDEHIQLSGIVVRRFVPMLTPDSQSVSTILKVAPANPEFGERTFGLLYRRTLGDGAVYTLATLPEAQYTTLPLHPIFLPVMVRMALRPAGTGAAGNFELGEPVILAGQQFNGLGQLEVEGPPTNGPGTYVSPADGRYIFMGAVIPGQYRWHRPDDQKTLAVSNVQLPAAEAELTYRPPAEYLPTETPTLVAHNLDEVRVNVAKFNEPEPKWSFPISIVLLLLCFEALMGSVPKMWQSLSPGAASKAIAALKSVV